MPKMPLIILAAGRGRRLKPFTDETPKALIEFGGKTITEMAIEAFSKYVSEVVIVVGHHHKQIRERIGTFFRLPNCVSCRGPIIYVRNRAYEITGAATSLSMAKHHWAGKHCVIMEGDHLFHPRLANILVDSGCMSWTSCALVDTDSPIAYGEETLAFLSSTGLIERLMWPASDLPSDEGVRVLGKPLKTLTIFRLSPSASLSLAANLSGGGEIIEPLNRVIKRHRMHCLATMGLPWIEIDTPEDLERAQAVYEEIKKR